MAHTKEEFAKFVPTLSYEDKCFLAGALMTRYFLLHGSVPKGMWL